MSNEWKGSDYYRNECGELVRESKRTPKSRNGCRELKVRRETLHFEEGQIAEVEVIRTHADKFSLSSFREMQ